MTASSEMVTMAPAATEAVHGRGSSRPIDNTAMLGMLLFIASEIMFFAGLFAAYFDVRARYGADWPAVPEGVEFGVNAFIVLGTVVLVSSSAVIQWGVWRIRKGDRTGFTRAFALTALMGATFLVLELLDWTFLATVDGLTLNGSIFGSLYFTMTGFHFAHVLGGVIGISIVLLRGLSGQFSARNHIAVEAMSAYWHFVDVVWIFLFLTYYILM